MTDAVATPDVLAHFGVKGMRWGVREQEENSQLNALEEFGVKARKDFEDGGENSETLKAKYEPRSLTSTQKKLLIGAGVGLLAGVGAAYYIKNNAPPNGLSSKPLYQLRVKLYEESKTNTLDRHWNSGVDLPAGTIFPRISSAKETKIRPNGFYASFLPEDVDRYKATLPTFWEEWGVGSPQKGGFVNNYKASVGIKAPSGSESFGIFKDLMLNNEAFRNSRGHFGPMGDQQKDDGYLRKLFELQSSNMIVDSDPSVKIYSDAVKARGYNALIDFSSNNSTTPMKMLDGSAFTISGHEPLTLSDMLSASSRVSKTLKHELEKFNRTGRMWVDTMLSQDSENSLAHFGVKGMRWGKREATSESSGDGDSGTSSISSATPSGSKGLSDGQKKALKYAAVGTLVAGAAITTVVLAKNGKLPMSGLDSLSSSGESLQKFLAPEKLKAGLKLGDTKVEKSGSLKDRARQLKEMADTLSTGKEALDQLRTTDMWNQLVSDFQSKLNAEDPTPTTYDSSGGGSSTTTEDEEQDPSRRKKN